MSEKHPSEQNGNVKIPRWIFVIALGCVITMLSWFTGNLYNTVQAEISTLQQEQQQQTDRYLQIQNQITVLNDNVTSVSISVADLKNYFKIK